MFETRYGAAVAAARGVFVADVLAAAGKIVAVLKQHPVRGGTDVYPLLDVHQQLTAAWSEIITALNAYPLAVAVDTNGRRDKFGEQLALLGARLGHVLVFYRNLTSFPDQLSGKAITDLLDVERAAEGVVVVGKQWG